MAKQNEFQFELYGSDGSVHEPQAKASPTTVAAATAPLQTASNNEPKAEALESFYSSIVVTPPEVVMVTPKMAHQMLTKNLMNRTIRQTLVDEYVNVILTKTYQCTHQGIAFDVDGNLIDGQHRLQAIIRTGITVPILVSRNCPRDMPIDIGAKRTLFDSISMGGLSNTIKNSFDSSVIKALFLKSRLSNHKSIALISNYFPDEFDFIHVHFAKPLKRVKTSVVAAAIFLAYNHLKNDPVAKERLIQFCQILYEGSITDKQDSAAIKLRDYLLSDSARGDNRKIAAVVHHHIRLFMDRVDAKKKKQMDQGFVYTYPVNAPFAGEADAK